MKRLFVFVLDVCGENKMEMRFIDIDFDVHKCIENERKSFSETPNEVL